MTVRDHIKELANVYGWHNQSADAYRQNFRNDNDEIIAVYTKAKSTVKNPMITIVSHCWKSTRMNLLQFELFIKTQLIYKMEYKDETPMPFGKHKGEKLANVPDQYLIWLHGQLMEKAKKNSLNDTERKLRNYIDANLDTIK